MSQIITVGLDLAKNVFRCMVLIATVMLFFARG